jgi:transcriptional regulator with PAS, ATPase and Fis domain
LLRVLQDGEVRKLGSSSSKKVDIRILTATHRNIETLVDEGKFREDLYYRIHVFTIKTPTLKEREEDIPLLAEHFLQEFTAKQGKNITSISEQATKILLKHSWPGNIRELRNVIERATVLCNADCLLPEDLLLSFIKNPVQYVKPASRSLTATEESMEQKILDCLEKNRWNKTLTAKELNISRATLWRKIKELSSGS